MNVLSNMNVFATCNLKYLCDIGDMAKPLHINKCGGQELQNSLLKSLKIFLLCLYDYACSTLTTKAERLSAPLGLGLQEIVNCQVGDGTQSCIFCKRS